MKVTKFKKRNRRTADRALGSLVCRFSFPLIEEQYDLRPLADNPKNAIDNVRKFISHHLREKAAVLDGASLKIMAELRAHSGGIRRKLLAAWDFGDDMDLVFKQASQRWEELDFEENWSNYETDI